MEFMEWHEYPHEFVGGRVVGLQTTTLCTMEKLMTDLHQDHRIWLNQLSFYKDDLNILQHRLEEVAGKNTHRDFLIGLEQFQNQLIIQREQLDILHHDIVEQEQLIINDIMKNPVASDHRRMPDHPVQRYQLERYEELFQLLRKDLLLFLAKWM